MNFCYCCMLPIKNYLTRKILRGLDSIFNSRFFFFFGGEVLHFFIEEIPLLNTPLCCCRCDTLKTSKEYISKGTHGLGRLRGTVTKPHISITSYGKPLWTKILLPHSVLISSRANSIPKTDTKLHVKLHTKFNIYFKLNARYPYTNTYSTKTIKFSFFQFLITVCAILLFFFVS